MREEKDVNGLRKRWQNGGLKKMSFRGQKKTKR